MRKIIPHTYVGNLFLRHLPKDLSVHVLLIPFSLLFTLSLGALEYAPWGKDATLTTVKIDRSIQPVATPCLGPFAEKMIAFHREVISPCDGPRSHYEPSSSKYTLDAMRKYGFFSGFIRGCDRLMRENKDPWFYPKTIDRYGKLSKHDPA